MKLQVLISVLPVQISLEVGTLSINYANRLRLIRKAEKLTQPAFSALTGVALSSIKNYETQGVDVGLGIIERILAVDLFKKYTLWLMTGATAPEAGQVAPKGAEELTSQGDIATAAIKQPR